MRDLLSKVRLDALQPRDRRALLIGLAIIVPVAVLKPYRAALVETRERIAGERQLLERELELLAGKTELPSRLSGTHKGVQRAEGKLVKAANLTSAENRVTELLEQIAELSRVLLQEVRTVPATRDEKQPDGMQTLRLSLRGESDLEGVVTLLHRIEQSPLLLRIEEFSLENAPPRRQPAPVRGRPAPRPQLGVMQFTVVVVAYTPAITQSAEDSP